MKKYNERSVEVEAINHLLEEVDINLLLKEQVEQVEATEGCW